MPTHRRSNYFDRRRNGPIEAAQLDSAGRIVPFSDFVRTRGPVLGMIYMRGEKCPLPFSPGTPFPGGQGTRRVDT
jgi:hypothetical protein